MKIVALIAGIFASATVLASDIGINSHVYTVRADSSGGGLRYETSGLPGGINYNALLDVEGNWRVCVAGDRIVSKKDLEVCAEYEYRGRNDEQTVCLSTALTKFSGKLGAYSKLVCIGEGRDDSQCRFVERQFQRTTKVPYRLYKKSDNDSEDGGFSSVVARGVATVPACADTPVNPL